MTLSHSIKLQQYLPFTVLKPVLYDPPYRRLSSVATVLTVYGIETPVCRFNVVIHETVATVLTVYGIETQCNFVLIFITIVATVLTVYGIETS